MHAPLAHAQPYGFAAHSGRVAQGSKVALAPRESQVRTPSPSHTTDDGAHACAVQAPALQYWVAVHVDCIRCVPVASHTNAV